MLLKKLPHVKRTDPDAHLVQTFFTAKEKKSFELACGELKMSHVLRCLALQYVSSNCQEEEANND